MARTYNDIYYNDDENSTAEILDDMKKLAESVDQQIGSIKSFNNDTSQFIEQVTPLMNTLSEQVIDMHQLADTMFTELEQVKEENKQLREDLNGLPERQASGESIDLYDSAEMRCELKISGNSKQETRSGKNLLNFNGFATKEISGVTITNNNDGSITLNGTATANISIRLSNQMNKTLTAGNYYFSSNSKGSVSGTFTTFMFGNNDAEDIRFATITKENEGFSTSIDYKKYWLWLYINSGITFTNYIMKPQLEAGTVKTNWELYGASPSPDYPSEVECCGDNINLFDKDNMTIGKIWSGTTLLDSDVGNASPKIPVKAGKTYIRNVGYSSNYIIKEDNSVVDIQGGTNAITIPENAKYWIFNIPKDIDINTIKAEEGLISTLYSPYGQGCINEVICNKNLAKNVVYTTQKGRYAKVISATYTLIKGKTYYFSFDTDKSGLEVYRQPPAQIGLESLVGYSWICDGTRKSFYGVATETKTIENTEIITRLSETSDTAITLSNFMVSTDDDISYVEHKEQVYTIPTQQPFRKSGTIKDIFIKINNKWYERHYIPRIIFDGTEDWIYDSTYNYFRCPSYIFEKEPSTKSGEGSMQTSNYFKIETSWTTFRDSINLNAFNPVSNLGYKVMFRNTNYTTVEDCKSWLQSKYNAGTPVYVDYISTKPIDIECTEEQSTILFDIEQNAKTYDKVTHMYSTDKISSYKEVTYKKDIETLFANTLIEGV